MYLRIITLVIAFSFTAAEENEFHFLNRRKDGGGMIPPPPPEARMRRAFGVKTDWFLQKLDHFDNSNSNTWWQMYQTNDAYYKPGGPIFLWIGGEGAIDVSWVTYGQMVQNAKANNALVAQLEHRFYGQSHPTNDTSVANLKYLTSTQALADLDGFVSDLKSKYGNPKVIVFGCSYPGSLAAYYRVLYPKSTVGAVASSAPILAKENFVEYLETIGDAFKYYNPQCYGTVKDAFATIRAAWDSRDSQRLSTLFNICYPKNLDMNSDNERNSFFYSLIGLFMGKAQYNAVGDSSELATFCRYITSSTNGATAIDRFTNWVKTNAGSCVWHSTGAYGLSADASWSASVVTEGTRQWLWQTCNEFAYYYSAESDNQPFGRNLALSYLRDVCRSAFGITNVANNVAATNQRYGGRSPNATNIFFLNGSIDPWHRLSAYERDLNPSSPSRLIEGISHCYDIFEARWNDPPALTKARQDLASTLSAWLRNS